MMIVTENEGDKHIATRNFSFLASFLKVILDSWKLVFYSNIATVLVLGHYSQR